MNHIRHFLHSQTAKTNYGLVLVALAIGAVAVFAFDQGWLSNLNLPFGVQDNGGSNVDRKIEFSFTDKFSGAALGTKTFYVYTGTPATLKETLTTSAGGIVDTAKKYPSGTQMYVKYVSGNSKMWYSLTVPPINQADEQQTYNSIDLDAFTIGTFTQTVEVSSIDASANYTVSTMSGNVAPLFVYQITNGGADNTGIMESAMDPVYGDSWGVWLVAKVSGAGYESVLPSGFDQVFSIGQATYGVIHLSDAALTKWKTSNVYEPGYTGGQTVTFSLDLSGYTVNTATVVLTAYGYCDPSYAQTHGGNFGNAKYQLSTDTITLDGT